MFKKKCVTFFPLEVLINELKIQNAKIEYIFVEKQKNKKVVENTKFKH